MRDDRRRSYEDDTGHTNRSCESHEYILSNKRKRSDAFPSSSAQPKSRGHIPMSERQQFALLRQMETGENDSEKGSRKESSLTNFSGQADASDLPGVRRFYEPQQHSSSQPHHNEAGPHLIGVKSFPSKLHQVLKSGDMETLKEMIKEGVDVDARDERGRTVLHELSCRNLPRLVAYLLKHGAHPNSIAANGDTALHEAARNGCARVVRTLLRHGADATIANNRGDYPVDVCQDRETRHSLAQYSDFHPRQSRLSPKSSGQPSVSSTHRHHHHHGTNERTTHHSSARYVDSLHTSAATPEVYTDSDDTGSTITPISATSLSTTGSLEPQAIHQLQLVPIVKLEKSTTSDALILSHKNVKKDPYAFEDDEADDQCESTTTLHPSGSASSANRPNTPTTTKPRPAALVVSANPGLNVPSGETSPPLLDSNGSSNIIGGPPLRLRFAKEAGQYTLMEHQQNPSVSGFSGGGGANTGFELPTSVCMQSKSSLLPEAEPTKHEPTLVIDTSEPVTSREPSSEQIDVSSLHVHSEPNPDDGFSQRVPPLRIKFASGASTDSDSCGSQNVCITPVPHAATASPASHQRAELAVASTGSRITSERSKDSISPGEECVSDPKPHTATAEPMTSFDLGVPKSGILADDSEQSSIASASVEDAKEELPRYRGGRTLRSHTAAQREKGEKERHDATPIKKRKLRARSEVTSDGPSSADQVIIPDTDLYPPNESTYSEQDNPLCNPPKCASPPPPPPQSDVPASTKQDEGEQTSVEAVSTLLITDSLATSSTGSTSQKVDEPAPVCEDIEMLACPLGPEDDKRDPELFMFENPYARAAALQKKLRDLVNNLVEVNPKAPSAYQQYLLVSRNYLLADDTPSLAKRTAPPHLNPTFVELFNQQEGERYAQALKHQSEREHLRLCAEQARIRAQTRAALANLSKPLSFCSVLAYKDLTYVPPVVKNEARDEENVRDRFTQRTFIGWLEDIRDTFQQEKKKMLCRQLHEAESLMMVQRLDWEMKLKEYNLRDFRADFVRDIPPNHVPLIHVPNDFPLFPNDLLQQHGNDI